jgi:rubredoxin-NAD+ reductase
MLAEPAAEGLKTALANAGVEWHLGTNATRLSHSGSGYEVILADGSRIAADLILSAIGLIPNTQLASDCGIKVNRGIVVDANLESSAEKVFALGDCAEIFGTVLPFVMPIMHAAKALAKTLSGTKTKVEFPPMPIIVKTPAYPIAILPPPAREQGQWYFDTRDNGVHGEFRNVAKQLRGFCLSGALAAQRNALLKEIAG